MIKHAKISKGDFHIIPLNGRNEKECVKMSAYRFVKCAIGHCRPMFQMLQGGAGLDS
jgi:hypothetical protein